MVAYRTRFFSSFWATSVMTLFGYIYSSVSGRNLREPKLLGKLVKRAIPHFRKKRARLSGWGVHYAVGLLFTEMYAKFWGRVPVESRLKSGFIFGAIGGFSGYINLAYNFCFSSRSPSLDFSRFAINLFIGHILFGIVTAFTMESSNRRKKAK